MGSINKDVARYEATAVYTHPHAKVDIILVHGLNGDPRQTWTAKTNGVFWPTDLLPASLKDAHANVLVYGANLDVYSAKHGANPSDNFIYLHAQSLVTSLTHFRKDEGSSRNPIIWICHSLGGILTKRALLYSNDLKSPQHEEYRSLYISTFGICFLGTPHAGSDIAAWATIIQAMSDAVVPRSFFHSESVLLKTLKKDNETLQNINNHFLDIYQRFKIIMAHECHKTDLKATKLLIVDSLSAGPQLPGVLYFGIEATHSNMCKFDSRNAPGFRTMMSAIRDWVLDAPSVIATRWRVEDEERFARAQHEIAERMHTWGQSQQMSPSSTMFQHNNNTVTSMSLIKGDGKTDSDAGPTENIRRITRNEHDIPEEADASLHISESDGQASSRGPISVKPVMFRPNSHFKGRETELKKLHIMLMDRTRRVTGTASVLVQSMPGGGKTQMARQYVFQNKHHYPGGIFWIRAKTLEELEEGYWDIARSVGLEEAKDFDGTLPDDTAAVVEAVRRWLNRTENWLLVLDGIHFDLPNMHLFIPFAKNTSIIYTSTEKAIAEDYLFDNPQIIALERLSVKDARELLLEEMGKAEPFTTDDVSRATELVNLMDRLPLMIHVAANHLKATKEPLAKYLRSFRSRPKAGHLQAYLEVRKQLQDRGFVAALNLMFILSFFDQLVPVELVALGTRGLDRSTPVKSWSSDSDRFSLNNSFQILISFALIDRNAYSEGTSASSSSKHSVDMDRETLDVLQIHGIVQVFFVDMLADEREVHFWLEQSIRVYCSAFDEAEFRINDNKTIGIPDDFRRFRMHGKRLLTHLDRFERRYPELVQWRATITSRLDLIEGIINELSQRAAEADRDAMGASILASVFERPGGISENDSETPASHAAVTDYFGTHEEIAPMPEEARSPVNYNPYHWHINYPGRIDTAEYRSEDVSRASTPRPLSTKQIEPLPMPDGNTAVQSLTTTDHRTVRKQSVKRYSDHVGAWRATSQAASDPRISLSRETAKGVLNVVEPTSTSVAAHSLDHIKKATIALPAAKSDLGAEINNGAVDRPVLVGGRPSYSHARVESTNEDFSVTPTFSYRLDRYSAPSSSYTAATLMRLRENDGKVIVEELAPVQVSQPLPADPIILAADMQENSTERIVLASSISLVGSDIAQAESALYSTRSSPVQSTGPFQSPTASPMSFAAEASKNGDRIFSPPPMPLPIEIRKPEERRPYVMPRSGAEIPAQKLVGLRTSLAASSAPAMIPTAYESVSRKSSPRPPLQAHSKQGNGLEANSLSAPTQIVTWVPGASDHQVSGYTSQPMSRTASRQSGQTQLSNSSLPRLLEHEAGFPSLSAGVMSKQGSSHSSPKPQPRSRRPSVVETEPSPRLPDFEEFLLPAEHRLSRGGNTAAYPVMVREESLDTSSYHAIPLPYPDKREPVGMASTGFLALFRDGRSIRRRGGAESMTGGTTQRRAASAGGRLTDLHRERQSSRPSPTLPAQSPSPGIRLKDGSFVEFGAGFAPDSSKQVPPSLRRSSWRRFMSKKATDEDNRNVPVLGLGIDQEMEA